jgi:hypothetical protein
VTFEEGTWAAWLHDLLQPHVARVLACDPRKNALLKAGNKSDRIDARKLSELLYLNKLGPVYHRRARHLNFEGSGAQLHSDDARFDAGDESAEGDLPKLGYSLICWVLSSRPLDNASRFRLQRNYPYRVDSIRRGLASRDCHV